MNNSEKTILKSDIAFLLKISKELSEVQPMKKINPLFIITQFSHEIAWRMKNICLTLNSVLNGIEKIEESLGKNEN